MRNPFRILVSFLFTTILSPFSGQAQTDSVIVTGRIRNLSARMYREASTVLISRNNVLQANRELVRPAPLSVDGTFRVAMPLIYPQEEMYFNYGRISTAFLAAPGTLTLDLNADSLFSMAVPFKFGGVNAQVNQQFARYKAFEAAYPDKPDGKKLTELIANSNNVDAFRSLSAAYQAPFRQFITKEQPFPLTARWIIGNDTYNAAAFLYDKARYENEKLPTSLDDTLRPPNNILLTAARASAMNRFAAYATQRLTNDANARTNGITVRALALLLERYGKSLTDDERVRLRDYTQQNSARAADLRFFDELVKRSPDTLQRLVNYETLIQRSIRQYDSTAVDYLAAYWLTTTLPGLTLNFARLLYDYARPQIKDTKLAASLDELYALEVKDSTRIRTAMQNLRKANKASALEISPGIFVTRNNSASGSSLLDKVIDANRGKVIYLLLTSPGNEAGRQAALDAQRLRNNYSPRDFALVYVPISDSDKNLWPELATRYNLAGDHLLLTDDQLIDAISRFRANDDISAMVINPTGKIVKRNAPLPGAFEEATNIIDKGL